MNGLDAADIAIHVLATAHHIPYRVPHHRAGTYDWFVDRLYGSAATWGAQFPELTYVFGGNGKLERDAAERGHETPEGFLSLPRRRARPRLDAVRVRYFRYFAICELHERLLW